MTSVEDMIKEEEVLEASKVDAEVSKAIMETDSKQSQFQLLVGRSTYLPISSS